MTDPLDELVPCSWHRTHVPTYRTWGAMLTRTTNPKHMGYKYYGGRGVTVCARWMSPGGFARFVEDMGERPAGTTLDRIDVDGNYEPANCRWATRLEQARNKRPRGENAVV